MPARRSGYGQPNIQTRLADEDKSLFLHCRMLEAVVTGYIQHCVVTRRVQVNCAKCEAVCMQAAAGNNAAARPALTVPEISQAIAWVPQAR
eukprot:355214-Chlamydomonas_euryale.AAC.1